MSFKKPRTSKYKLVVKRSSAGLGLFAGVDIPRGKFVIEYFGELLTDEEADKKGGKYLFEIDKKWTIDGTTRKNLARYINHSCKPNCYAEIDGRRVFIYTKRRVYEGEELAYHYGKGYFEDWIKPDGCRCEVCLKPKKKTRKNP